MAQPLILIGDFGKDLDDEHALVLASRLHKTGIIRLTAVIANLNPAMQRARLAKGTLRQLGLPDVPVGIGTAVSDQPASHPYEMNVPYLADPSSLCDGAELVLDALRAASDGSATLVLNSGMTDAARLLREHGDLVKRKVLRVAIMGGVKADGGQIALAGGNLVPDNAHNNTLDWESALYLYQHLQECGIPMTVVTREVAYLCQMPFELYDLMESTGNPIGTCLKGRQQPALQTLFEAACAPAKSAARGALPLDRDRRWFVEVFCGSVDPGIAAGDDIWPHVDKFNLYDPINLIAAVPALCERFFHPTLVRVNTTTHRVIGVSREQHGIKNIEALRSFLQDAEIAALTQTSETESCWDGR